MSRKEHSLDLLFACGHLEAREAHNVAMVNKLCYETVKRYVGSGKFCATQRLVEDDGFYIDSVDSFRFAISVGYFPYEYTYHALLRHNAPLDVVKYVLCTCSARVLPGAIVEAAKLTSRAYLDLLLQATSPETLAEARTWIQEDRIIPCHCF
jgi:hypothetical protein